MIARRTLIIMASRVFMQLIGYVSWFFIVNNISNEFVGSIGFAIYYLSFVGVIADLGFSTAHIKFISEGRDPGKCIGTYFTVKVVLMALLIIFTLGSMWFYKSVYPAHGFEHSYDETVIMIMLLWAVLSNLTNIPINTFMGRLEVGKTQFILVAGSVLQNVITIIVALTVNDVYVLAYTWVAGALINLALGLAFFTKFKIKRPDWRTFKDYAKFSLPLMLVLTTTPFGINLCGMLLKFFWGNAEVSLFWNAQKFAAMPEFISSSLITVLFPAFSGMISRGNVQGLRKATLTSERYLSMIIFPISFIGMALSRPFIEIMSDIEYANSAPIFSVLLIWAVFWTLSKPYSVHFGSFNKPVYSMYLSLIFAPTNLLLSLIFIPASFLGIELLGLKGLGAATAIMLAAVVNFIMVRLLSQRLVKIPLNRCIPKHIVAAAIPACIAFILDRTVLPVERWYILTLVSLLGLMIYIGVLWLFKEFGKNEVAMILDTIHLGKAMTYFKEEMHF